MVDTSGLFLSTEGRPINTQQCTPELQDEAVRDVIERGYSVAEVSSQLGVSTHIYTNSALTIHRPDAGFSDRSRTCSGSNSAAK